MNMLPNPAVAAYATYDAYDCLQDMPRMIHVRRPESLFRKTHILHLKSTDRFENMPSHLTVALAEESAHDRPDVGTNSKQSYSSFWKVTPLPTEN